MSIDQQGVGELVQIGVERGRKVRPKLKVGICGEHGGDPASVAFCHEVKLDYVSCSPFRVPIARLAAAQAALGQDRGQPGLTREHRPHISRLRVHCRIAVGGVIVLVPQSRTIGLAPYFWVLIAFALFEGVAYFRRGGAAGSADFHADAAHRLCHRACADVSHSHGGGNSSEDVLRLPAEAYTATLARKSSTSSRRLATAVSTVSEASRTTSAEERVSVAAPATSPSTATTWPVPSAALATLCEISPVAEFCSSTEAATAVVYSLISCMRAAIWRIASTAPAVEFCTAEDVAGDFLGRLGGLHRQRFDLGGDHREALAGLAGARGFDGGVEREQIGLAGDVADQLDHVADLLRAGGKPGDLAVGRARFARSRSATMLLVWVSWRLISAIECDNSSAATAAVSTLAEASLNACTALSARCEVWSDEPNSALAVERMAVALSLTLDSSFSTCGRNEAIAASIDRAPLLLVADGGALLLGVALFGDVLMGGDPAAARQRLVLGEHDAAVAGLHIDLRCFGLCATPSRIFRQ